MGIRFGQSAAGVIRSQLEYGAHRYALQLEKMFLNTSTQCSNCVCEKACAF